MKVGQWYKFQPESCRLDTHEEPIFIQIQRWENIDVPAPSVKQENFPLSLFVQSGPSTDGMRPTYIREVNLLNSVYWFKF